jgi:hypothetical protein
MQGLRIPELKGHFERDRLTMSQSIDVTLGIRMNLEHNIVGHIRYDHFHIF